MPLPYLDAPEQSTEMIAQFGGYNHKISISENEFYDMKNMSSKDYPLASVRSKRGTVNIGGSLTLPNAQGIVAKDNIILAYTAKGDIGVTISENVEAAAIEEIPGEVVDEVRYTKICDYRNDTLVSLIKSDLNGSDLSRCRYTDGVIHETASGKTPTCFDDGLYIEWPHEAIEQGVFWTKMLFSVFYVYERDGTLIGEGNNLIIAAKNCDYLADANIRNALIGAEIFAGSSSWKKMKILGIDKVGWSDYNSQYFSKGDWTITLTSDSGAPSLYKNDEFVVRISEPLTSDLEGEAVPSRDESSYNLPTRVAVTAESATHVRVLLGQTLTINGNSYYVSGVETADDNFALIIDRPHEAISAGATVTGDRLFLCELNPSTGEAITSNIFAAASGEHKMLEMGGNIVIFPEKIIVNSLNKNLDGQFIDIQRLELTNTLSSFELKMTDINGNAYEKCSIGNTAPYTTYNGMAWIDTSSDPPVLNVWSSQTSQWAKTQAYCQLSSGNLSGEWQEGDAIELEFDDADVVGEYLVPVKDQKYFVVSAAETTDDDGGYIRFPVAMKVNSLSLDTVVTVKRTIPEMDFVIENENRLWGCKYGMVDGETINEIFACKLGDPKNWHHFSNTSTDSYYVSMGADGAFTGAISYGGNPCFFRENCMHRIYGNYPANYSLKTVNCHGVEKGSDKSLTVMNDVLFYKSPVGIMAYTGATPVNVSENFGYEKYKNAVAGSVGSKMYFAMKDSAGSSVLFTFNDNTKLWHKEDDLACKEFITYEGEVYALTEDNRVVSMEGVTGEPEDDFEWYLTSGSIGYNTPFHKHLTKLNLRLLMELGARTSISIQYDSSGTWEHITNIQPSGKVRSIAVPVMPRRCDHFALKLSGKGACKILSVTKYTEEGSDYD